MSDSRVKVTSENGTETSFIVVGEGNVTVNNDGGVSANIEGDSRLVTRTYLNGQNKDDKKDEKLIANGKAVGEVYVMSNDGTTVSDNVSYSDNTTIESKKTAENEVEVSVDRAESEGKVVLNSVSEKAVETKKNWNIKVDGEAAVQAETYSELKSGIGAENSRYLVGSESDSTASAESEVLVAVNHFSERKITMTAEEDKKGSDVEEKETAGTKNETEANKTMEEGKMGGNQSVEKETGETEKNETTMEKKSDNESRQTNVSEGNDTTSDQKEQQKKQQENQTGGEGQPGFGFVVAAAALLGSVALYRRI